ncbi:membrane protein [Intrasporangium oryzae NRRL B-24470]|uniref:Membrane protein n=1 Tax=Intrasporangium oryzae NRRL B-24470 TaxID=1386089 RepID=W9GHA7_9MICO|nr:hypothetical protein [Intrasporangium oryzae]EWT03274.1 membrane protein [Intrasporangium oryzae NRRL B-24470]
MNRSLLLVLGGILFVIGCLWTLQGLGIVGGSVMSGVTFWAIAGPIVALFGIFVAYRGSRR